MEMIDQITNEILIAKEVLHTNNIDTIASQLQYSPILIVNALYAGRANGKLTFDDNHRTIATSADVEVSKLAVTEDFAKITEAIDLNEQLELLMTYLNSDEKDMSVEELATWMPGVTDLKLKMIAYLNTKLAMYELPDPKDKKSVYTFITLKENADKQFGAKQFKKK